jgi:hypothetical protein
MFLAWGEKDEFNLDAQSESFAYRARQRGLSITTMSDPNGRHSTTTARKFLGPVIDWLAPKIAPYSPPLIFECHPAGERGVLTP